ncbi:MAG: tetratricopeptide repeat protein [Phycisphaerae bacterium]
MKRSPAQMRYCLLMVTVVLTLPAATAARGSAAHAQPPDADERPAATLEAAYDLFMAGSYDAAIRAYRALARDAENSTKAGIGLARCHMQLGQYDEALSILTAEGAPASAAGRYHLARVLLLTGQYAQALEHAQRAIAAMPEHAGARLVKAEVLDLLGDRDGALEAYRWFDRAVSGRADLPADAEWITDTAVGFLRYSVLTQTNVAARTQHVLHEMLQVAYERVDRTYWPARIAAADLLRERYNNDEEDGSVADYRAALQINPSLCEAHVGLGEVALEQWDFEEAQRRAELALAINPKHPAALHLRAEGLLRERRYKQALAMCERALRVNPNDVTALSISAAAGACMYDYAYVQRMRARVEAINPANATVHRMLGGALSGIRQYADAEREYLRAIELAPTDANPRTELGMMYMQWGLEEKARDVLEASWTLDSFNKRTKFTLELLESLSRFARAESEHFIVRYDPAYDPALGEQILTFMEGVYPSVTGDFTTQPEEKTIIEVFPTQRSFAVRITGSPWIHTIGACTGRVIAMASPRRSAKLRGTYNYARVLTHEFTHTVTLAATQNRIPHWLTEGLAVAQEDTPREFYWLKLLAEAVRRDRLFTLESIDWAFIRPQRPTDRTTAYAQSEWMCEYIVQRFGYDTIAAVLARFRRGQTQQQVLEEELGLQPETFDRDFRVWARRQAETWGFDLTAPENVEELRALVLANNDDASVYARLARAEYDAGEYEHAVIAGKRALQLDENQPTALETLAQVFSMNMAATKNALVMHEYESEALPLLERLLKAKPDGCTAPKLLGAIALRHKERDKAERMFKRLQRLCPSDPASWRGLAGLYLENEQHDLALPQLVELARIQPDEADVAAQIAHIHRRNNRLQEASYWYRRALHIDPFNSRIHGILADVCMQTGHAEDALREYLILTKIEPQKAGHLADAAAVAHKLGDDKRARDLARRAVELDPASPAASLLP